MQNDVSDKKDFDSNCEVALFRLGQINKIYKYHVLHVSPTKINMWIMLILLEKYGEGDEYLDKTYSI